MKRDVHPVIRLEGIPIPEGSFGFPREMKHAELEAELQEELRSTEQAAIVLSHAPPLRCLDGSAEGLGLGNPALRGFLEDSDSIRLVLCGHVHHARGQARLGKALVLNVACGCALLNLRADGDWDLSWMAGLDELGTPRRLEEAF